MPILHAVILGIVQGLAEFLPISSSGHLELVPWLFGWDDFAGDPQLETTFDVALHMGTLAGAVAYFRTDLVHLARGGIGALRPRRRTAVVTGAVTGDLANDDQDRPGLEDDGRLAWLLLVSALPAALTAALLEDFVVDLNETHWLIGVNLVVFGLVLLWADRLRGGRGAESFRLRDALFMGAAQAVALAPGVSRSGVTITAGRRLGFSRDSTARLAFLMSLPITAGAGLYKGVDVLGTGIPTSFIGAFVAGMATSGATGFLAVWGTIRLVRTRTFTPFVVYRVVVGLAVILIAVTGLR